MANNKNIYHQFREASDRVQTIPTRGTLKFPIRKTTCWYNVLFMSISGALLCGGFLFLLKTMEVEIPELLSLTLQLGLPACVLLTALYLLIDAYTSCVVIDDEGMRSPVRGDKERIGWNDIEAATLSDNIFWDDLFGLKRLTPKAYAGVELRLLLRNVADEERRWEPCRILNSVTNEDLPLVLRIIRERLGSRFTFPNDDK